MIATADASCRDSYGDRHRHAALARSAPALRPERAVRAFASERAPELGGAARRAGALAATIAAGGPAGGARGEAGRRPADARPDTVGELLEHLPQRQPRGAHGRGAAPASRRRSRCRCARSPRGRCAGGGCARWSKRRVFDATGSMRATFFNQPWLVERYAPGTRLLLHGKTDGAGDFSVAHHAVAQSRRDRSRPPGAGADRRRRRAGDGRPLSGHRGRQLDADPDARAGRAGTRWRTCPRRCRRRRGWPSGLPDRASALAAMHFPRTRRTASRARERLAFEELLLTQLVFLRRRARRRSARTGAVALDEPAALSERWLRAGLPFALTGDQRRAIETIARGPARERADAAAADGRGRQRQDGGGAVRDAARGRARPARRR